MPKFDITIEMSPEVSKQILPAIQDEIDESEYRVSRKVFTCDAIDAGSTLLSVTIAIASSGAAFHAIGNIISSWIKTRSSKTLKISDGTKSIEASNLSDDEVKKLMQEYKKIVLNDDGDNGET
ncbi:hypothetical protein [Pantoea eucrina]|uniref:hypothetical protein n=1 Tax=Pantoea eucrina TaxID=472693 RepID=UPI00080F444F|nr:hypothetical protein [Pantoea eucrina]